MTPLLLLGALVCGAGCGNGTWINDDGLAVAPGASLLTLHVAGFDFVSQGEELNDPAGAPLAGACDPSVFSYDVALASAMMAWSRCLVSGTESAPVYTPSAGSRLLATSEMLAVRMALGAVHVSGRTTCGTLRPFWSIELGTPSGELTYGDDFDACDMNYAAYADGDGLDALAQALASLTPPPGM